MTLGRALKLIRGPLTQLELGERIGENQDVVSKWENDKRRPSLEDIAAVDRALQRPLGTWLRAAGFVEDTKTTEGMIRSDGRLGAVEVDLVVAAYRTGVRSSARSVRSTGSASTRKAPTKPRMPRK